MAGRITFPGSPWPEGHALKEAVWSGHIDDRGLWFDFHFRSVAYPKTRGVEDEEVDSDWEAPSAWQNYGSCILSSLHWPGVFTGIAVGDAERPFDMARLRRLRAEPLPARATMHHLDGLDRTVGLYLFAHGTAADHDLRFTRRGTTFDLAWRARIAHRYGKPADDAFAPSFRNSFELRATDLRFGGFDVPAGLPIDVAEDLMKVYTADADAYRFDARRRRFQWSA